MATPFRRRSALRDTLRAGVEWSRALGFDPVRAATSARGLVPFARGYWTFRRQAKGRRDFALRPSHPCLADRYQAAGAARGHYFHQALFVTRLIYAARPARHFDVGSDVAGFVAHVACFCPVTLLDIRPLDAVIPNVRSQVLDIMAGDAGLGGTCESLSCLHALEHLGLGRYGDPIDYDGHLKGWRNLSRLLAPAGRLYLSLPMGEPQRIEFDAHRVFSLSTILAMTSPDFEVERFAFVDDAGDLSEPGRLDGREAEASFGCSYGCAILALRKKGR